MTRFPSLGHGPLRVPRPRLAWLARPLVALLVLLAVTVGALAQVQPPADVDATLDAIRGRIDAAQKVLAGNVADADLLALRQDALAAQAEATDIATALAPQLASVQARLTELGAPTPGAKEDPDVARQRAQLDKNRSTLDAQLKLARLLAVEGGQLGDQAAGLRRSEFQARLGERTSSILSPRFWLELGNDAPRDAARLSALARELGTALAATRWWVWVAAVVVVAAMFWARGAGERAAVRLIAAYLPAGRVRRSLYALAVVLLWTASFGVLAELLRYLVEGTSGLSRDTMALLDSVAGMVWFAGYLDGLLHALISARRPSWRLPPVPDSVAERLRRLPLQLALISIFTRVVERLAGLVNASLAFTVAINCVVALALALTVGVPSMRAERVWLRELGREGAARRPLWLAVVAGSSWVVLGGSFICLLLGFVAFGSFAVKQVVWTGIVLGSAYLLAALVDDVLMTWLAVRTEGEPTDAAPPRGLARTRDQAAVLLSGVLRVAVALTALMLVLAPFGEGPTDLWRRTSEWQSGLAIGEVQIRPAALLQAALVLVGGLLAVRVLKHWLTHRWLPTTALDAGMRTSATTLFGYAGVVLAVSLALSAVGIGLERVAWVASALSVGIGFGLQAVVQNFVSGLILLAERPVKVGDWVSLGGVEGDIRRINVRATEIQMGDRSTVIVPNSEFITKVVRNVTWSDPLGLVQVKLPVPLGSDVTQVRDLMRAAFVDHPDVLETPAPNVLLDGLDQGFLQFNATGFTTSPRLAAGVRSALLFDVLRRLGEAGITLARPPTMLLSAAAGPVLPPSSAMPPAPDDDRARPAG